MTIDSTGDLGLVPARLVAVHGAEWAAHANAHALALAGRWNLLLGSPLPGGTMSLCVDAVTGAGAHVVLKIPAAPALGQVEKTALTLFPATTVPEVLASDTDTGALLIEFVDHIGVPLSPARAARLTRLLHTAPLPPGDARQFPNLTDNLTTRLLLARRQHLRDPGLDGAPDDPDRAERVLADLTINAPEAVLLHGDFQDKNVLVDQHGRATAIDPMPCLGDPAFDLALWVATRNHHAVSIADTLRSLHGPDTYENQRLDAWTWALAVLESRSHDTLAWTWQREYVNTYRHLSEPV